jgi:broad specificity phosphatase PhoE
MIKKRAFVFVRHGESEGNKRHLCQGQLDPPLTPTGRSQARDAAAHLRGVASIFRIVASPLGRAAETARIIAPCIPHTTLLYHDGLKERHWGAAQGQHNRIISEQEAREASPDFCEPSPIEGLEELSQLKQRLRKTFDEILGFHGDELPLIVGHGCFFRTLCNQLLKTTITKVPNATPALCIPNEDGWSVQWITKDGYQLVA